MFKHTNIKDNLSQQLVFNDELKVRQQKLLELSKENKVLYPNNFRRNYTSDQLHKKYHYKSNEELKTLNITISIAGRMIARRVMGKATFITLRDGGGCIQLYITVDSLASKYIYKKHIKQWDLGDIIGVKGILFKTHTGELSVRCQEIKLLTKSLRPLPDKFHGLSNLEIRYRQRYLDLMVNDRSRQIFKMRSLIISEIRQFMKEQDFIEVETPMMHIVPGGAIAQPFITYHNKFKMNMYLRIAPELYLKKLIVGGFERIFEINRNFRNEGISPRHNPEFTMMEVYIAYVDYLDMIEFVQDLFRTLVKRVLNNDIIKYNNYYLDFKNPFTKMSIQEAILHYLPEIRSQDINNISVIINIIKLFKIQVSEDWDIEKLHITLFEEIVSKKIVQPTCVTHYPIEVSPLARCNDMNPKITDRFELFIAGQEIGNGFSELNDPHDQRQRFLKQINNYNMNSSNSEDFNQNYDEDYLTALEHGLPPTAGIGIGIDRLIMLLTNTHHIRDVILFPTLRPKIK